MHEIFGRYVTDGYVRAIRKGDLTIYDYTPHTVFEANWDQYTTMARGLVLASDGRIVGRPWPKFFNMGERPETQPSALPAETPELAEKYDGSLIIVFENPESRRWTAITRGDWDNVQTRYANAWLRENSTRLEPGYTYLFELVAPWNRIVVPYAKEQMILLGRVHTESGADCSYRAAQEYAETHGLSPLKFQERPVTEIDLADETISNQEGFVARFSNGFRVKLKYAQYVRLHKIMTGLSIKGIWEMLAAGKADAPDGVPDEFMEWFTKERGKIQAAFNEVEIRAKAKFAETPVYATRKEYALAFQGSDLAPILFRLLDNKPYADVIWKRVKPVMHQVFKEDEA